MNEYVYKKYAETLLTLAPGFPMDADGIAAHIETQGIDSFMAIADAHDPGISEIAKLLTTHGEGGIPNGEG